MYFFYNLVIQLIMFHMKHTCIKNFMHTLEINLCIFVNNILDKLRIVHTNVDNSVDNMCFSVGIL